MPLILLALLTIENTQVESDGLHLQWMIYEYKPTCKLCICKQFDSVFSLHFFIYIYTLFTVLFSKE